MPQHVAVLFRGPLRPDIPSVLENVTFLCDSIRSLDCIPVTYLATWCPEDIDEMRRVEESGFFDNFIFIKPLINSEIPIKTERDRFPLGGTPVNAFRQYYLSLSAISVIANDWRFSHIVHSRTDMIATIDNKESWFNNDYCTIHIDIGISTSFINDQFAVAPPEIMHKAWHYGAIGDLVDMIEAAQKPEDVLQAVISKNGVEPRVAHLARWELNASRHIQP